ncbi:AAA family ATPase [Youngiibacter multivorans]|uniref:AAA15 family ATPase/GTPase n=1 Tax=Youngiibacter multivorans TaxID=937251 RepID=A0ABS4G7R5_9CLOT|nr:ATP/GTP-binding protein [Youngiibacter multivorans]MBP1920595.1 AAA15 family ATPase/GTPase [Youngiibacter multivorans]
MLLQFTFSNFGSFEGEASLDMRASGSSELSTHVRAIGNDKVLPVASIYGANASGKSTVYSAFEFMSLYVSQSFYLTDEKKVKGTKMLTPKPFAMSSSKDKPSEFEVNYVTTVKGKCKYINYGFMLDKDGVGEEWLKTNSKTGVSRNQEYKTLFHRTRGQNTVYGNSLERFRHNIEISLSERVLLLSLGAKLKVKELIDVRDWFLENETIDCSNYLFDGLEAKIIPDGIVDNTEAKNRLLEFINSFDSSIIDLEFEKAPKSDNKDDESYLVFAIHESREKDTRVRIPFDDESSGTIKMFLLYQVFNDVLRNGSLLFADELDIKLHPLLMRNILLTMADPSKNPNNAQLIFTTHNTVYMDMGLLRRDEIWFTEKNTNVSDLYSLSDFIDPSGEKVRKDANYERNYLLGRYGAIPSLSNLLGESDNGWAN